MTQEHTQPTRAYRSIDLAEAEEMLTLMRSVAAITRDIQDRLTAASTYYSGSPMLRKITMTRTGDQTVFTPTFETPQDNPQDAEELAFMGELQSDHPFVLTCERHAHSQIWHTLVYTRRTPRFKDRAFLSNPVAVRAAMADLLTSWSERSVCPTGSLGLDLVPPPQLYVRSELEVPTFGGFELDFD